MQNGMGKPWREGCHAQTTHSMAAYLTYASRKTFSWPRTTRPTRHHNLANEMPHPHQNAAPTSNFHLPPKNFCSEQLFPMPTVLSSRTLPCFVLWTGLGLSTVYTSCTEFLCYSWVNLILLAKLLTFFLSRLTRCTTYLQVTNQEFFTHRFQ